MNTSWSRNHSRYPNGVSLYSSDFGLFGWVEATRRGTPADMALRMDKVRKHPTTSRFSDEGDVEMLPELAFADDIALLEDTINKAEAFLHKVQIAPQSTGLFLNAGKSKAMHINRHDSFAKRRRHRKGGWFCLFSGYTNTSCDINTRISKAWGALNALQMVWESRVKCSTKIRLFKSIVECISLYSCESWTLTTSPTKKVDGTYTRMLKQVKNVSWRAGITNDQLDGQILMVSIAIKRRRPALLREVPPLCQPSGSPIFCTEA